jgi:hypothetical protein
MPAAEKQVVDCLATGLKIIYPYVVNRFPTLFAEITAGWAYPISMCKLFG